MTVTSPIDNLRRMWAPAVGYPAAVLAVGWLLLIVAFSFRPFLPMLDWPIGAFALLAFPAVVGYRASLPDSRRLGIAIAAIGAALPIVLVAARDLFGALYEGDRYGLGNIAGRGAELLWMWMSLLAAALGGAYVMRRGSRLATVIGSIVPIGIYLLIYQVGTFLAHL